MKKEKVLIIGGGIAGLCSAYYLLTCGYEVRVMDKGDMSNNCSYGNAGMIVPSHFVPLAAPGVVSQGIRWLFNKSSPFFIRPSLNSDMIGWGMKFLKYAKESHVNDSAPYIKELNELSKKEYYYLKNHDKLNFSLIDTGILMLYKTRKIQKEEQKNAEDALALGLDCELLDGNEIQQLEPDVQMDVLGGVHFKSDATINPGEFMRILMEVVVEMGGKIYLHSPVEKIRIEDGKIKSIFAHSKEFNADHFVMATGADLGQTAKLAGLKIPMMPGKGYSFMTTKFDKKLRHAALLLEDKVALTPMGNQVRIGGTMELGGKSDKINSHKLAGIAQSVGNYYPDIHIETPPDSEVWHGYRPCSPDGLPYLGNSKKLRNLTVVGGGGMMGVSCGPGFGKIVCELINGAPLSMDISMFNPERFS